MKAAIYSRKSKFTGKGESIENQVQMCKDYAETHFKNKKIHEFLIYEDEGFSGGNTNRPEFQRLLEDVKGGKFDVLICYRLDRISRNVADFSTTLETLQKYDVDFVSIREQFDTSSPMGRAMIYIASVFAQLERETIAERVRDNMLELAKTGRWLGGVTPIGYKASPIKYLDENMAERSMVKLKQVPEELELVKLIYAKYLEYKSLSGVETYLLQNYYKTRRGAEFDCIKIRLILSNTVYVKATKEVFEYLNSFGVTTCGEPDGEHGLLSYNKQKGVLSDSGKMTRVNRDKSEWIAACSSHKGIIEAEDWILVQKVLNENKNKFPNNDKTHNSLLTGILKCDVCGSKMGIAHGHSKKDTGERIYYYKCSLKRHSHGTRCNNKNANVKNLDTAVLNSIKQLGNDKNLILKNIEKNIKQIKNDTNIPNKEQSIKKLIIDKNKQIENLLTKLSLDDDVSDLIISKIKSLKNEISELNNELDNLNELNKTIIEDELDISFISCLLEKCSLIDSLTIDEVKQLIHGLVESMTWNGLTNDFNIKFVGSDNSKKK